MPVFPLRVLCLGAALLVGTPTAPFSQTSTERGGAAAASAVGGLPSPAERNIWYRYKDSNTVVVFVHGIFSNIRDCWHYKDSTNPARSAYWPEMISRDAEFADAGIFLAGYYTAPGSRAYDIPQSAADIHDALVRRTRGQQRVIDKPNIIFVAHSTGGIVVRHLLYHNQDLFKGKNVGLVLIASPSRGSYYANYLRMLSSMFRNQMAQQLQVNNPYLDQLHYNFRDLLARQQDRGLLIKGIERCENHMIVVRDLWFDDKLVVDPDSCAAYFGSCPEPTTSGP
ncbi:MAG: alpha/beta hydrolase [Gemmatimonadota bacterium]